MTKTQSDALRFWMKQLMGNQSRLKVEDAYLAFEASLAEPMDTKKDGDSSPASCEPAPSPAPVEVGEKWRRLRANDVFERGDERDDNPDQGRGWTEIPEWVIGAKVSEGLSIPYIYRRRITPSDKPWSAVDQKELEKDLEVLSPATPTVAKESLTTQPAREWTTVDPTKLTHGLYRIFWKGGGVSLASVGSTYSGRRWMAPSNWTCDNNESVCSTDAWSSVERVELLQELTSDKPDQPAQATSPLPKDTPDGDWETCYNQLMTVVKGLEKERDQLRNTVELLRNAASRQDVTVVNLIEERDNLKEQMANTNFLKLAAVEERDRLSRCIELCEEKNEELGKELAALREANKGRRVEGWVNRHDQFGKLKEHDGITRATLIIHDEKDGDAK